MLNRVVIMGRITVNPELRQTQGGVSVLSFTVAVDRRFTNPGGERQADFIYCVAWRHNAEFISKYFVKGQMIAIDGVLQSRNYIDKNGNNRSVTEVVVENASFCGSKAETSAARSNSNGSNVEPGVVQSGDSFSVGDVASIDGFEEIGTDDSELPF